MLPQRDKFSSKSQQIYTSHGRKTSCCCYHKGTNFQANHNINFYSTTGTMLLLLPQRYKFSSKSQQEWNTMRKALCCCCYHKGTNFQANHNRTQRTARPVCVVVATTKVQIFKQITTCSSAPKRSGKLLLLPQRYKFSSKSQLTTHQAGTPKRCCCYHKGTNFQANHNGRRM